MAIEIVDLAIKNGGTVHINHHFPMVFPCFPIEYCHFPSFFVGFPEGTIGGSLKVLRRPQLLQPHSAISQKKGPWPSILQISLCVYIIIMYIYIYVNYIFIYIYIYTVYTYHYIYIYI